ncbi:hypothetical protein N7533_011766 [Penicillium manginii]|uniref:uncharacterized protein n=1 Tax=Penicillium manginii TaxID=203109 RepID=UPI00254892F9|nr:uncharacterized protein N7533_011766 [Penicillium manginii]KAJ5738982.1 hypothetical protein N7533_011766 [Penicillium manginii]
MSPPIDPVEDPDRIHQLVQMVEEYQQQDQQAHETIIQAGELDEATPWLNRTGWVRYLQGTPRQPLFESTQRPEEDAEGPERIALVIWEAMERLASVSQEIAKACGHLVRIDVVRTMKDESPHKPLLAYLDATAIQKHVAPWQQIMMFFARTQIEHDWESPKYSFTPRQQQLWDAVWRHAQAQASCPDPEDDEPEPFEIRPIEHALLTFCIDLLRQKIRNDEYGCAMICATAVIGCGQFGWATPENFPPPDIQFDQDRAVFYFAQSIAVRPPVIGDPSWVRRAAEPAMV